MSRACLFALLCAAALSAACLGQDLLLDLFDVIGVEDTELLRTAQLSPDGGAVSWSRHQEFLCFVNSHTALSRCRAFPRELTVPIPFRWSPDGHFLVGTEDAFRFLHDPDIWLVDAVTQTFVDCTDDGVWGSLIGVEGKTHWIDVLPTWNPRTGDLLFFRSVSSDDGRSLDLMRVSPGTCLATSSPIPPEVVVRLTGVLPDGFPFTGSPAISPDGSTMACIILGGERDDPSNGIWLFDLIDETAYQLAGIDALRRQEADWHDPSFTFPVQLSWTPDSRGLIVFVTDLTYSGTWASQNICHLDPESGALTYLISYDGFETFGEFSTPGDDGHTGVFRVPRQAILTRSSEYLITVHAEDGAEEITFMKRALSPGAEVPVVLSSIPVDPRAGRYALFGPQLTTMSEAETALVLARYLVSFADLDLGTEW